MIYEKDLERRIRDYYGTSFEDQKKYYAGMVWKKI